MTALTTERPAAKSVLPFRLQQGVHYNRPCVILEYDGLEAMPDRGVRKIPYTLIVEDPDSEVGNALGKAILKTIRLCQEAEPRAEALRAEREHWQARAVHAEAEMQRLKAEVEEIKRRAERQGGKR